jgi:hypothetical protein
LASAQLAASSTLQGSRLAAATQTGSASFGDVPSSNGGGGGGLGFSFGLGGTTGLGLDVGSLSGGRGGLESLSLGGFSHAAGAHAQNVSPCTLVTPSGSCWLSDPRTPAGSLATAAFLYLPLYFMRLELNTPSCIPHGAKQPPLAMRVQC